MRKFIAGGLLLAASISFGWAQDADYCAKFNRCRPKVSPDKITCAGCSKREIYKDFARCMNCGIKERVCTKCGLPKKGMSSKRGGSQGKSRESKKKPAGTNKVVQSALAYLASKQSGDGSWETRMAANTGKVTVTSFCALALMASGDRSYADKIQKAVSFVQKNIFKEPTMKDPKWDQTNWQVSVGACFLAEAYAANKSPDLKGTLEKAAVDLVNRMEDSGGWGHSNSGPNALNYVELEVMSTWALGALGMLKKLGFKVSKAKTEKAFQFIRDCCNTGQGAVGYSPRRGQKGHGEEGRTGGAIWLWGLWGKKSDKLYKPMVQWWQKNLDGATNCHGSIALGCLGAAIGGTQLGGSDWDSFVETVFPKLAGQQAGDGSFRAIQGTGAGAAGGDSGCGPNYSTGLYTLVMLLDKGKLSYLGRSF